MSRIYGNIEEVDSEKIKKFSIIGQKKMKKHCLLKLNFQTKKMLKNVTKKKVNYY